MHNKILATVLLIMIFSFSMVISKPLSGTDEEEKLTHITLENKEEQFVLGFLNSFISVIYDDEIFDNFFYVSLKKQMLFHIIDNQIVQSYSIAGSRFGIGNEQGSYKTPIGLHTIAEKHGEGVPAGGILIQRKYTGKTCRIHDAKKCVGAHDVTSRILWLKGEEPGINKGGNVDSFNRYIYIHGTPEEGLIGTPSSDGCIRMRNREVINLFNHAYIGMKVLILSE